MIALFGVIIPIVFFIAGLFLPDLFRSLFRKRGGAS
jgi:hypothetical protein